jgi:hypothetical protein
MTPPDPLDPLLDRWGASPEQSPLAPEVWRRLTPVARTARRPRPTTSWWSSLDLVFGRASFAAAFVVACALLGLFLAEVRVSHLHRDRDHQLAETYLRLIDPLLLAANTPPSPPSTSLPGS